jgi:hypothetical protein
MEILLSRNAIAILNVCVNEPRRLAPDFNGMSGDPAIKQVVPYKAPDTVVALELVAITRWLENKVLLKQDDGRFMVPLTGWKGTISKKALLRLKEIVKHYEPWGLLTHNCAPYMELLYALDGKPIEADLVDVEKDG